MKCWQETVINRIRKKPFIILSGFLIALCVDAAPTGFDRYQIILERKPFGALPADAASTQVTVPAAESFARTIRLSALYEREDGTVRVGLVDAQSNDSFFLGIGDSQNGIELVAANFEDEEAVLRRGTEMAVLRLADGNARSITAQEHQERTVTRQTSYEERRRARMEELERRRQQPPPEPRLTGEMLERHLQDYQMEVIRQGLPALPIPLTEEMDRQLVEEGVLPP